MSGRAGLGTWVLLVLVALSLAAGGFALARVAGLPEQVAGLQDDTAAASSTISDLSARVDSLRQDLAKAGSSLSDLSSRLADLAVGPGSRSATRVVAASNASSAFKAQADYVADGTADDVEINAAIASLPLAGGTVLLSEGTFNISAPILIIVSPIILQGQGLGVDTSGRSTVIRLADGANTTMLRSGDTTVRKLTPRDLTFNGNGDKQVAGDWDGIDVSYLGIGSMAEWANFEVIRAKRDGIHNDSSHFYVFGDILTWNNGRDGIRSEWIQGSNVRIYSSGNASSGFNGNFGDSYAELYLENNAYWGGIMSPHQSIVKVWTKSNFWSGLYLSGSNSIVDIYATNNCRGDSPQVPAEVYIYNAQNLSLTVNTNRGAQSKPGIHGLFFQNNVAGNAVNGHVGATGYAVYLNDKAAGWNPAGLTITGSVLDGALGGFNIPPPSEMIVRNNAGFSTEGSGSATVAGGQTAVVVTHGLTGTPATVHLTPTGDTGGVRYWVSDRGPETFTITLSAGLPSDITFDWTALL